MTRTVLVTIDSLRADHYRYMESTRSYVGDGHAHAYATFPSTLGSFPAIVGGEYAVTSGLPEGSSVVPHLDRYSVGITTNHLLSPGYGYADGFDVVEVLDLTETAGDPRGIPSAAEGIAFDPTSGHLFVLSKNDAAIFEYTPGGAWRQTLSVSHFTSPRIKKPAGLAIGPASADPEHDAFYLVARGVDNDFDPSERDGALYEAEIRRLR
jgi:hypothetical protein